MSGQYAEQQKGDMKDSTAVPSKDGASTTASGTPRTDEVLRIEDNWGAIRNAAGDVEDGVTPQEAHDEMVATLTALARKFERELIEAASALTTLNQQLKQHGDMALPIVNGGASTAASGTHSPEPWHTGGVFSFDGPEDDELDIYGPFPEGKSSGPLIVGHVPIANARRIVACVNACKGIPTEDLERWGPEDECGWIPVTEKMPDSERSVLYYHSMILVGSYNKWDGKWRFDPDEMVDLEKVTHWMPLPPPPEVDRTAPETSTRSADE